MNEQAQPENKDCKPGACATHISNNIYEKQCHTDCQAWNHIATQRGYSYKSQRHQNRRMQNKGYQEPNGVVRFLTVCKSQIFTP